MKLSAFYKKHNTTYEEMMRIYKLGLLPLKKYHGIWYTNNNTEKAFLSYSKFYRSSFMDIINNFPDSD